LFESIDSAWSESPRKVTGADVHQKIKRTRDLTRIDIVQT
jgi:hypothetical protein